MIDKEHYVLNQEVNGEAIKPEEVVSMDLKAGEISLHDNRLLHGSGPNHSDRIRAGQTDALLSDRGEMRPERLAEI